MVSVRLIMLSVVAVRSLRRGPVGLPLRSLRRCAASSDGGERRIDSAKNDLVKLCKSLHRRKGRESTGLVLLEGTRLVGDALAAGSGARHVLVSDGVEEGVGCLPAAAPPHPWASVPWLRTLPVRALPLPGAATRVGSGAGALGARAGRVVSVRAPVST